MWASLRHFQLPKQNNSSCINCSRVLSHSISITCQSKMQIYSPITPKNKIKKKAHTPQISQDKPEQLSIVAPNVRIKTWGGWRWLRVLIGKAGRRGGGRLGGRQTRHDGRLAAVSGEHRGRGHGLCDADAARSCFFAEDGKSSVGAC